MKNIEVLGEENANIMLGNAQKRRQYLDDFEDLPFENDTISQFEMRQLRSVNALLVSMLEKCEREFQSLELIFGKDGQTNPEGFVKAKKDVERKIISDAMTTFDKLDVWTSKFSTESQGTGEDLTETPDDSIYYMTRSGASLRFKMANRDKGIVKVIQPIMEKVFFENIQYDISESPKEGYFVKEYATQDFLNTLKGDPATADYKSSIKKFRRNNKLEIPRLENIKYQHEGSPVNKIHFERSVSPKA